MTTETPLNMRQENLRLALVKAYSDALSLFLAEAREDHLELLVEKYEESGNKSFDVLLPWGEKVGSISLAQGKAENKVTDEAALFEYAEQQEAIVTETVPRKVIPAKKITRLNKEWFDSLVKNAIEGDGGELIDPATGEVVPGLTRVPAPAPDKFSVRYEPNGREKLALAYKRGQLNQLAQGTALPVIEAPQEEA